MDKDSEFLEKNMLLLEQIRPQLYKKIKEYEAEHEYTEDGIKVSESRDGHAILSVDRNGIEVRLNSNYRPIQEAEKWAQQYSFQNMDIKVIMFGLGNGIFLREVQKNLAADGEIFLYEPDINLFLSQLRSQDMSDLFLDRRILLFVEGINLHEFSDLLQDKVNHSNFKTRIVCCHPGYDKLFPKEYDKFCLIDYKAFEEVVVNENTMVKFGKRIAHNIIRNLRYIKASNYLTEFVDVIDEQIPVIIVSAGPSLDKNIEELKNAQGKAIILATDTALKYLIQKEIHFDAIVTVDPKKNVEHFDLLTDDSIPLFCAIEGNCFILDNHKGRKIWFNCMGILEGLYQKFGYSFPAYNVGGSVACVAFMIAVAMGQKNIIMIGQDLAFQGDVTHAGKIEKHTKDEAVSVQYVEGIDGSMVKSRGDWIMYREWLENAIASKSEYTVIDATEGGALIHGSKVMTLKDAIEQYCLKAFNFTQFLAKMPPTFNEDQYQELKQDCMKWLTDRVNLNLLAKKGLKAVEEYQSLLKKGQLTLKKEKRLSKTLKQVNKEMEKPFFYHVLEIAIEEDIREDMERINVMTDDAEQNMLDSLEISAAVYRAIIRATDNLEYVMENFIVLM